MACGISNQRLAHHVHGAAFWRRSVFLQAPEECAEEPQRVCQRERVARMASEGHFKSQENEEHREQETVLDPEFLLLIREEGIRPWRLLRVQNPNV